MKVSLPTLSVSCGASAKRSKTPTSVASNHRNPDFDLPWDNDSGPPWLGYLSPAWSGGLSFLLEPLVGFVRQQQSALLTSSDHELDVQKEIGWR
jgi:hypothetical protein